MSNQNNSTTITVGPSGSTLLLITFIVLKLTHVINWSWWWVLSPLWIPLALLAVFGVIFFFIWLGVVVSDKGKPKRHYKNIRNL